MRLSIVAAGGSGSSRNGHAHHPRAKAIVAAGGSGSSHKRLPCPSLSGLLSSGTMPMAGQSRGMRAGCKYRAFPESSDECVQNACWAGSLHIDGWLAGTKISLSRSIWIFNPNREKTSYLDNRMERFLYPYRIFRDIHPLDGTYAGPGRNSRLRAHELGHHDYQGPKL